MKKLLIILMLCTFMAPEFVQAEKGIRPALKSNTTVKPTKNKGKKFTLITVYRSKRNTNPFLGNDGDFLPSTPTNGNVFHSSYACQQEWLNKYVNNVSGRKNGYYFSTNGTQVVESSSVFLIVCNQIIW